MSRIERDNASFFPGAASGMTPDLPVPDEPDESRLQDELRDQRPLDDTGRPTREHGRHRAEKS